MFWPRPRAGFPRAVQIRFRAPRFFLGTTSETKAPRLLYKILASLNASVQIKGGLKEKVAFDSEAHMF